VAGGVLGDADRTGARHDAYARHRFSYAPLVTHRFALDEVDRAYELMDARAEGFVKAVLIP
jgi:threonine dehydrogenase-like Zn-dependent dehydrogenase